MLYFSKLKITLIALFTLFMVMVSSSNFLDLDLDYWFMGDSHHPEPDYFFGRYESYNEYKPKKQKFIMKALGLEL